jgi:hypothetical protein
MDVNVHKSQAGADSFGNTWPEDGAVVPVPYEQAVILLAIPDGGFSVVDTPADAELAEDPQVAPDPEPEPEPDSGETPELSEIDPDAPEGEPAAEPEPEAKPAAKKAAARKTSARKPAPVEE